MIIEDSLYGKISIEKPVEDLLYDEKGRKVDEMWRLSRVSQGSLDKNFKYPTYIRTMDSRLDHSLGVSHLAGALCDYRPEQFGDYRLPLILSGALHDAAQPPFAHTLTEFQEDVTGMDHEQYLEHALKGTHLEDVVLSYGYTLEDIVNIITGKTKIIGELINNSFDLDNIDNVLRFQWGAGVKTRKDYNPYNLLKTIRLKSDDVVLGGLYLPEITKWNNCRKIIYDDMIYEDKRWSTANMVKRAAYISQKRCSNINDLKKILKLGDSEASAHLSNSNNDSKSLIEMAAEGRPYTQAVRKETQRPSKKIKELCGNWMKIHEFCDALAEELKLNEKDIIFDVFKHNSKRDISRQIGSKSKRDLFKQSNRSIYDVRVFVNPDVLVNQDKLNSFLANELYAY